LRPLIRGAGKKYGDAANWRLESKIPESAREMTVVAVDPKKVDADIVFSALPTDLAKTVEPDFCQSRIAVASNASALRMAKTCLLSYLKSILSISVLLMCSRTTEAGRLCSDKS